MYEKQELINNQYEVLERLAGGMGYVYIVLDQVSEKTFAIKTLKDELLENKIAAVRFEREARTWINLGAHENVVHALSFQRGKQPLLILEYVDGLNLQRIVSAEPAGLSMVQVLNFATQMADGLAFAHGCQMPGGTTGVVHRDLKPGNIMITSHGVAKLTDFGLARAQDDSELTCSGKAMGTFPYMPPEQWKDAHSVTGKADIYSLGIVFYEMVVGMRPFPPAAPAEIMFQTLHILPEPVASYRPDVDPQLADLIQRCLNKVPEDRPDSADSIAEELRAIHDRMAGELNFPASCPTCGYVANRESLCCIVCGTTVERQSSRPEEAARVCGCGAEVPVAYHFCIQCGKELRPEGMCGACETTNPPDYQFCCQCGSQLAGCVPEDLARPPLKSNE